MLEDETLRANRIHELQLRVPKLEFDRGRIIGREDVYRALLRSEIKPMRLAALQAEVEKEMPVKGFTSAELERKRILSLIEGFQVQTTELRILKAKINQGE